MRHKTKILRFICLIVPAWFAFAASSCQTAPKVDDKVSAAYAKSVDTTVDAILLQCAEVPGAEVAAYRPDTLTFTVNGFGHSPGIAYRSRFHEIPKDWASCIQEQVSGTSFPQPPVGNVYTYSKPVDWEAIVKSKPQLDTDRTRFAKVMYHAEEPIKECYTVYRAKGGVQKGKVVATFKYQNGTSFKSVDLKSDDVTDPVFLKCVKEALTMMRPPQPTEQHEVVVQYPFVFSE